MASDREIAQRKLVEALSQHSTYLHRASTATVNKLLAVLDDTSGPFVRRVQERLDNLTAAELQAFASGKYTTSRLKGLRAEIDGWAQALAQQLDSAFTADAKELAGHEANYARDLVAGVFADTPPAMTGAAAYAAAMDKPVFGEFVDSMFRDIPERARRQVYATIRQGITEGRANSEIIRALRGTKALQYKDGILQATRNAIESAVRTARAHVSNAVYEQQWRELGVTQLVWSAHLELRTCNRCAPLDGKRFEVDGKFSRPPLHPRCRCALVPSIDDDTMGKRPFVLAGKVTGRDGKSGFRSIGDMTKRQREEAGLEVGQVSAKTTFSDWFARQPERYQREWLGASKFKLYKEGGYSLDKFVDPRNKPYTLEELRQKDGETFKEVFG